MSSDESDYSSSDDETEKAFFKPKPKQVKEAVLAASDSEASDSDDDDEDATAVQDTESAAQDDHASELKQAAKEKTKATVYVEGISYDADESALVSHFSACGAVKEVRMPRYQDSGKPRGYAHIVFDSDKAAKKALAMDGQYMMKRYLSVRPAETPRTLEAVMTKSKSTKAIKGCRTVFVKQLPYEITDAEVKEAFESCGTIISVRLPVWNHTKNSKGFGYVEFETEAEAVAATKKSGMKVGNRMVLVELDTGAPKASFRTTTGQYWNKVEEGKASLAKRMSDKGKKRNQADAAKPTKKKLRL
ncbi:hypothetical protein SDRG_06944 [Saprolegnia diclina VS20]|uniref:RRM domain-containing protein n=1 Tax=Saprolegnia diclina (strain VS20) TaxID=1156394 RepID=T0QLQ7_SAPDV|nr:hypothetical protein SDRG_06944 [Saprolegnia diclina VS20]EQC35661.1 hypothetical protein SDRG_06944 [Saprolegnia diclina VS20]|eukprot:XP_008610978.1 hypothetical protein SDRG_06944 [Saprolegnia diclina VS20]